MHGFILNGDLSPVLLQNKLRKTPLNATINLFMGLLCICAIFRIKCGKENFFTCQPYASAGRVFSSVFCSCCYYIMHVVSFFQ